MRRPGLVSALVALPLLAAVGLWPPEVRAQAGGAEADAGVAEAPVPDEALRAAALLFFHALREGSPEAAAELCDTPFSLDGEEFAWRKPLLRAFAERLARTDLSARPFHGVRLLTGEQMVARHGPPPERLGSIALEGAWVAVANFGGQGHVAVFRRVGGRWRSVAYTD